MKPCEQDENPHTNAMFIFLCENVIDIEWRPSWKFG